MQAIFDVVKCKAALAQHGKYVAGATFFWQDFL